MTQIQENIRGAFGLAKSNNTSPASPRGSLRSLLQARSYELSSEGNEPVGSLTVTLVNVVKVVKVCFAYVVKLKLLKPFTGEVVKVCSAPGPKPSARRGFTNR